MELSETTVMSFHSRRNMAEQIVKNNSKAYGYNYASLADIVNQGFTLPKMRIAANEFGNFIEYFDGTEWQMGAPIVVPEMKGMNAAQAMGSALTYARRYTAQMALGLACDDDAKLEKTKGAPEATGKTISRNIDFAEVRNKIKGIETETELNRYWLSLGLSQKQAEILKPDFAKRKEELGGM